MTSGSPPRVSIIIPCYNANPPYLIEAVQSAHDQDHPDVEVIVVNDGSTRDDTLHALEGLPNILLHHQANAGVSAARNAALRIASGKYVLPLDADDRLHPQYVSQAVELLENNPEVLVVTCHVEMFGDYAGRYGPDFSLGRFLSESIIPVGAAFPRERALEIGGFDESLPRFEDQDFFLRMLATAADARTAVHQIPAPLYLYRKHAASVTATYDDAAHRAAQAKVLRNNLALIGRYAEDYLEWLDHQAQLLGHFKSRYGRVERQVSRLGSLRRKLRRAARHK